MAKVVPDSADDYSADDLVSVSPMAFVQLRPSLSLGPAENMLLVSIRELADNSLDEYRAGYGKTVHLTIFPDGSAQVEDSGRGVPTGINTETGENGIFMAFGKIGSGGKFGGGSGGGYGKNAASLGTNGVGTSAVNALSLRFQVTVYRNDKMYSFAFKNGSPGHFVDADTPTSAFTPSMDIIESKDPRTVAEKKARPSGTTIRFWPNLEIYGHDASYHVPELREILKSSAFLTPGLHIVFDDYLSEEETHDEFEFDGGLVDLLDTIRTDKGLHVPLHFEMHGAYNETARLAQADGTVKSGEVTREVKVDAVLSWGEGYETNIRSYVNTIYTYLGGVHVQAIERAMSKVILNYIKNSRGLLRAKEELPTLQDIEEGLTAIISVEQDEAKFTSQDKTKLSGTETGRIVAQVLTESLTKWFEEKKNASTAKLIATKIVNAMRVRVSTRTLKETARKKTALETSSSMPVKLVPCGVNDSEYTELQICEGDSALGGLRNSRDARYQAIYPLKGKPLNVHLLPLGKVLENTEWADLVQIIGGGVGPSFDVSQMRYKRIILLADADPDGSHIKCLLISGFWKYMRPLIEQGHLYAALPPLFSVTTTGKVKEKFFAINETELTAITKKLDAQKKNYGKIQRHKGLGEYSKEVLASQVMDPRTRSLRRITVDDVIEANRVLELSFGKNAEDRRDWIVESRSLVSDDELDMV